MSQSFAVVRRENDPLPREILSKALQGVPGLTAYDLKAIRGDEAGMVARGFSPQQAAALQANLQASGFAAEIIEDTVIPVPPEGKAVRGVEFAPDALLVLDAIGRKTPLSWAQVGFIVAGSVHAATFARVEREVEEVRLEIHHGMPMPVRHVTVQKLLNESSDWFLRAEILSADGKTRYSVEAEQFRFVCLGDRFTKDRSADFCTLIREIAGRASSARLNRGAAAIVGEPPAFVYYPRKNHLHEEMSWMLWRAKVESGLS